MSVVDLHKAFKLIELNDDQADFEGQKPEKLIALAESALGLRFPPTYRAFLSRYGCGDIAGQELYGIIGADFDKSSVPDAIWITLDERKRSSFPEKLVIVYATDDGTYFSLDCSSLHEQEECPVVAWIPGKSKKGDRLEIVAEDYGQFLLETIELALS